jgi:hypothetical protein
MYFSVLGIFNRVSSIWVITPSERLVVFPYFGFLEALKTRMGLGFLPQQLFLGNKIRGDEGVPQKTEELPGGAHDVANLPG